MSELRSARKDQRQLEELGLDDGYAVIFEDGIEDADEMDQPADYVGVDGFDQHVRDL